MRALPLLLLLGLLLIAGTLVGNPDDIDIATRSAGPSALHPLGTDHLGRDLAARLVTGAQNGLAVVALTTALGFAVGIGLGAAMHMAPPFLSATLRRICDLILAVPTLVMALGCSAALGATPVVVCLALSLGGIAATAHVAETLVSACVRR